MEAASLAADWVAEGVLVLLPPFCCLTLGSSEDLGWVLGGADRWGVHVMGRQDNWRVEATRCVRGRDNR